MPHPQAGESHWFAFQVKPKHEALCSMLLREKGYEDFLPRYTVRRHRAGRVVACEVPLFSQYVFCRCRWEPHCRAANQMPIITTPGILRIVGFGKTPAPIDDEEIDAIRRVIDCQIAAEPWAYLRAGQKMRVLSGPLKGMEGLLICEEGIDRLLVSITLLQRSVAIKFGRDNIEPVSSPHEQISAAIRAASEHHQGCAPIRENPGARRECSVVFR
jgi:transcription antitermination factor NusG